MSRILFALAWFLGIHKMLKKIKRIISPPKTFTFASDEEVMRFHYRHMREPEDLDYGLQCAPAHVKYFPAMNDIPARS